MSHVVPRTITLHLSALRDPLARQQLFFARAARAMQEFEEESARFTAAVTMSTISITELARVLRRSACPRSGHRHRGTRAWARRYAHR